jgi:hypothetical protein
MVVVVETDADDLARASNRREDRDRPLDDLAVERRRTAVVSGQQVADVARA